MNVHDKPRISYCTKTIACFANPIYVFLSDCQRTTAFKDWKCPHFREEMKITCPQMSFKYYKRMQADRVYRRRQILPRSCTILYHLALPILLGLSCSYWFPSWSSLGNGPHHSDDNKFLATAYTFLLLWMEETHAQCWLAGEYTYTLANRTSRLKLINKAELAHLIK